MNNVTLRGNDILLSTRLSLTVTTEDDLQITNNFGQSVQLLSLQTHVRNLVLNSGGGTENSISVQSLWNTMTSTVQSLAVLNTNLTSTVQSVAVLNTNVNQMSTILQTTTNSTIAMADTLKSLNTTVPVLQNSLNQISLSVTEISQRIAPNILSTNEISARLLTLYQHVDHLSTSLQNVTQMSTRVDSLSTSLQNATQNATQMSTRIDSLSTTLQNATQNATQMSTRIDSLSTSLQNATQNATQMSTRIDSLSTSLQNATQNATQMSTRIDSLSTSLQNATQNVTQMSTRIDSLSTCALQTSHTLATVSNNLGGSIATLKTSVEQLLSRINTLNTTTSPSQEPLLLSMSGSLWTTNGNLAVLSLSTTEMSARMDDLSTYAYYACQTLEAVSTTHWGAIVANQTSIHEISARVSSVYTELHALSVIESNRSLSTTATLAAITTRLDDFSHMCVSHNSRLSSLEYCLSRDGSNNIFLGESASNIYIGSPNNPAATQNIFIGTVNDNVIISGTLIALQTVNSTVSDARITLNKGALVGTDAGIQVEINGVSDAATWSLNPAGEWVAKNQGGATFNLSTMSNIVFASLSTLNISVVSDVYVGRDLHVVSSLSVGGQIRCQDLVTFNNTCDARLKTDVLTISTALETVNRLRPVEFTWKNDVQSVHHRNTRDAGFIAQEIHEIIPYTEMFMGPVVEGEEEPIRGVRHERIIPYLVRAIQELTAEVRDLRARMS